MLEQMFDGKDKGNKKGGSLYRTMSMVGQDAEVRLILFLYLKFERKKNIFQVFLMGNIFRICDK